MSTELKDIKKLLALLENHTSVGEVTITHGDASVTIKKNQTMVAQAQPMMAAAAPIVAPATMPQATTQPQSAPATPDASTEPTPQGEAIRSPMVGTCYLAPSPEAEDFVKVGDTISEGQTLCLIEAMKMFNKIKAEKSGTVKACLVQNGQPVEFDQDLFIID